MPRNPHPENDRFILFKMNMPRNAHTELRSTVLNYIRYNSLEAQRISNVLVRSAAYMRAVRGQVTPPNVIKVTPSDWLLFLPVRINQSASFFRSRCFRRRDPIGDLALLALPYFVYDTP